MEQTNFNHIDSDNFVLQDYLDRIHFTGDINLSIDGIRKLMQHQLYSVPFENLDVQAGKSVSLLVNDIVHKIVGQNRGGYCYEVNGIFALVLQEIGIPYRFVAARPLVNTIENAKTHMALIAVIENEEYLIDLGFGGSGIREPLQLNNNESEVQQGLETFSLVKIERGEYLLRVKVNKEWKNLYSFDLSYQRWIDFKPANHFNSTHSDSIFTQSTITVLQTPLGKKILFGNSFKSIENGIAKEYLFEAEKQESILLSEFNLKKPS